VNPHFRGYRWPDERQRMLLRAALSPGDVAAKAWNEWLETGSLDDIDGPSFALLPAVWRNLRSNEGSLPEAGRLKGMYRRTWYQNQVMVHGAAGAARALGEAGVPVVALKGLPLLLHYYNDLGARPMNDVDLLVPEDRAVEAARIIEGLGWKPELKPGISMADAVAVLHGSVFHHPGRGDLDLHWHAIEECCRAGDDELAVANAQPLVVEDVEVRMFAPADLLLHICIHGSRGYPQRVVRWVLDAAVVIEVSGDGMDWGRLVAEARRRRLTLATERSLEYLQEEFSVPVPLEATEALAKARRSMIEKMDYRAQGSRPTITWSIIRDVARYLRQSRGQPAWKRPGGFLRYLQHLWGLERRRRVPGEGARRLGARLRETGFRPWRRIVERPGRG